MLQIHFKECSSTQDYLKRHWKSLKAQNPNENDFVVSTSAQPKGVGRRGNTWIHFKNNLAFSFNLGPNTEITLTSLEIGVLISLYFQQYFNTKLYLKWPNDLINQKKEKVGGILCQLLKPNIIIAGCGLNLYLEETEKENYNYKVKPGPILSQRPQISEFNKIWPLQIVEFIQQNRLHQEGIQEKWNDLCIHLNQKVKIGDQSDCKEGIFRGLGPQGEALLEEGGTLTQVISGPLFFVD